MRKLVWIAPVLLLAGCTGSHPATPVTNSETAEILVPAGTPLRVRVDEPLNTRRNRAGDSFFATLETPVEVDGATLIPSGTRFKGRVTAAEPSDGIGVSRAVLAVELESFTLDGATVQVRTNVIERAGASQGTRHIGFVAGGAAAGEGATASAATQELVGMPADSTVTFALRAPLRM